MGYFDTQQYILKILLHLIVVRIKCNNEGKVLNV